eukprot:TRINITY_DN1073_c0_g1_i4.p1 TRINITY_DN1073_c0_g1~~TRINITY_DN1073_c0_g1_i4.p1  ORF type:complete len:364 (+),score=110.17 TRINITY_DN1073_c0_g1_i4:120-1094(+)
MISLQSVMEGYMQEKDHLNHEAAALGLHLKKVEKEDADRIAQQNEMFLEKLKEQEKQNQAVAVQNDKVAKLIVQVRKGNDKLSALVEKEQKLIKLRRSQFAALKKQFLEGQERVNALLKGSDQSAEPSLLQVGDETTHKEQQAPMSFLEIVQEGARRKMAQKRVDEMAMDVDTSDVSVAELPLPGDGESMEMPSSELQVAAAISQKPVASPSSVQTGLTELESATGTQISTLATQASKLSQATARSLAELKASFQEGYKAGSKRHSALMQQQSALKASLKSVEEQFAKLKATYKRVTGLRQGLEQELQKNGALLGQAQNMAAIQ